MRIDKIVRSHSSNRQQKVDAISFIIPEQPYHQFGIEFESLEECLKYCDDNGIPYTKEKGCFDFDTYDFPTVNN